MAEPENIRDIIEIFLKKCNFDYDSDFVFKKSIKSYDNDKEQGFDVLCEDNKNNELKIQHIEAVPIERGVKIGKLKSFENGDLSNLETIYLQQDDIRIEEALGRKANHYDLNVSKDLILLIDFGLFCWKDDSLFKMREVIKKIENDFRAVYCVHVGKEKCEKLS